MHHYATLSHYTTATLCHQIWLKCQCNLWTRSKLWQISHACMPPEVKRRRFEHVKIYQDMDSEDLWGNHSKQHQTRCQNESRLKTGKLCRNKARSRLWVYTWTDLFGWNATFQPGWRIALFTPTSQGAMSSARDGAKGLWSCGLSIFAGVFPLVKHQENASQ